MFILVILLIINSSFCAEKITLEELGINELNLTAINRNGQIFLNMPKETVVKDVIVTFKTKHHIGQGPDTLMLSINDKNHAAFVLARESDSSNVGESTFEVTIEAKHFSDDGVAINFSFIGNKTKNADICGSSNFIVIKDTSYVLSEVRQQNVKDFQQSLKFFHRNIVLYYENTKDEEHLRTIIQIAGALQGLGYNVLIVKLPEVHETVEVEMRDLDTCTKQKVQVKTPEDLFKFISLTNKKHKAKGIILRDLEGLIRLEDDLSFIPSKFDGIGSIIYENIFTGVVISTTEFEKIKKLLDLFESNIWSSRNRQIEKCEAPSSIQFENLNYATQSRDLISKTSFLYYFNIKDIYDGNLIDAIALQISNEKNFTEQPIIVNAYFNEQLVKSYKKNDLNQGGLEFKIPHDWLLSSNKFSVDVIQETSEGLCRFRAQPTKVQIFSNSELITREPNAQPKNFLDIPSYFSKGFEIIIPTYAVSDIKSYFKFFARMGEYISFSNLRRVRLGGKPENMPFIKLSDDPESNWSVPVQMPGGRLELTLAQSKKHIEYSKDELAGSFMQLVGPKEKDNSPYGLWIMQNEKNYFPPLKTFSVGPDYAIAFDKKGKILFNISDGTGKNKNVYLVLNGIETYQTKYLKIIIAFITLIFLYLLSRRIRSLNE